MGYCRFVVEFHLIKIPVTEILYQFFLSFCITLFPCPFFFFSVSKNFSQRRWIIKIQSSSHKNSQIVTPKLNQNKKRTKKKKTEVDLNRPSTHALGGGEEGEWRSVDDLHQLSRQSLLLSPNKFYLCAVSLSLNKSE